MKKGQRLKTQKTKSTIRKKEKRLKVYSIKPMSLKRNEPQLLNSVFKAYPLPKKSKVRLNI